MQKNTLQKITSWQLLAVIVANLIILALAPVILSSSAAADTPIPPAAPTTPTPPKGEATWFYKVENCSEPKGGQADAALAYTGNDGKTVVFDCAYIIASGTQNLMLLDGPKDCSGTFETMQIGQDADHVENKPLATATTGTFSGHDKTACKSAPIPIPVNLTNTYEVGSIPPPPTNVGSGTWTTPYVADQAEIKANYTFDLGSGLTYKSPNEEAFDETNLSSDGVLTLSSQTQAAPGTSCDNDSISYGPDATSITAVVTINLWGYEDGSDLHCYQRTGSITLSNGSFSKIGGSLSAGGNTDSSGSNCPITGDGDWLFCIFYNVFSGAIGLLSQGLQALLYTPVEQIFTTQIQSVFNAFRNVGVALLVIVGLFMVLSQAAGLEIFAAYTVRKALPRLVIAMIGISVAWPILQFVVTFFNDVGVWTIQAILSTTAGIPQGAPLSSFSFGSGTVLVAVIGGGFLASTGIMMSLLGTLLLAFLIGFIVLAIRQMVILIAIVMAPLAIAASILPSTQKIWTFWRDTLLTALAMFPIMMAFLGAGEAMSAIAGSAAEGTSDAGRSIAWKLLSVFCVVGALAVLPFAFRIAGGLVGTIHSLVTSHKLSQGAFGALSAYRGKKAAERWGDTKEGRLLRPGSLLSRVPGVDKAADFVSGWASTGALIASGHISRGRRNAYRANAEAAHAMEVGGKDADFAPARGNEDYYLAGLRGYRYKTGKDKNGNDIYAMTDGSQAGAQNYFKAKGYTGARLRNAVGQTTMMKRKLGQHGFEIAAAMYTPGSGTAFSEGGVEEMDKVIASAARGDHALAAQILNVARQNAQAAGRIDLSGAGFAMHLGEITNVMAGGSANGDRLMQEAFMATDAVSLSRARKNGLTLIMDAVTNEMNDLQAKEPMTAAIEGQVQGIETQLKDPTVTGTIRASLQAQLNGFRKEYATPEEQRNLGRLKEGLEKLRSQSLMYAAPERNIPIFKALNNTRSAQEEVNLRVRTAGSQTVDPDTGNIALRPIHQQTAYGSEEQRDPYRRSIDPNNPDLPNTPTAPPPANPAG